MRKIRIPKKERREHYGLQNRQDERNTDSKKKDETDTDFKKRNMRKIRIPQRDRNPKNRF